MKMVSWNVNGIRAISGKDDWSWFSRTDADIIALQETKAEPEQLDEKLRNPEGWHSFWHSSQVKKGYSGVAVFCREKPLAVSRDLPDPDFQGEGRLLHLELPDFHFFNVYFPNGGAEVLDENGKPTGEFRRVPYKMGFYSAFLKYAEELRRDKPVVVCGDFNTAHKPIDLARPKQNEKVTGFLPMERAWLDSFVETGYVDVFRHINGDAKDNYSWWDYKTRARLRNIGWRIDYFFCVGRIASGRA